MGKALLDNESTTKELAFHLPASPFYEYSFAIKHAPIGIAMLAPNGTIHSANKCLARMLGYSAAQLEGRTFWRFVAPELRPGVEQQMQRLRTGAASSFDMELSLVPLDGNPIPLRTTCYAVHNEAGQITGFIAYVAQPGTTSNHQSKTAYYHALLMQVSDAIVATDLNWRITAWNAAAERIYGWTESEALGTDFTQLVATEFAGNARDLALRALFEKKIWRGEVHQIAKDRKRKIISSTVSAVVDEHGEMRGVIASNRDITELRQLEKEVLRNQKMEAIGLVAAGIAHEISTPAQFVSDNLLYLETIANEAAEQFQKLQQWRDTLTEKALSTTQVSKKLDEFFDPEFCENIGSELPMAISELIDGNKRILQIVNAMKQFSHPGAGEKKLCNLADVIEDSLLVTRNRWKRVCLIDAHLPPDGLDIVCNSTEIGQVILNLILNAVHAIEEKAASSDSDYQGKITIQTKTADNLLYLQLSDNGIGIPANLHERIFEPFFTTKDVGVGTGQGLAIAHKIIVQHHKGKILLDSIEGQYTTFTIVLPLTID